MTRFGRTFLIYGRPECHGTLSLPNAMTRPAGLKSSLMGGGGSVVLLGSGAGSLNGMQVITGSPHTIRWKRISQTFHFQLNSEESVL